MPRESIPLRFEVLQSTVYGAKIPVQIDTRPKIMPKFIPRQVPGLFFAKDPGHRKYRNKTR